ncbi:MAG TPA: hypothetical protein ENI23_03380 [bacterium]|nr:hypothetical protein [bacterium]
MSNQSIKIIYASTSGNVEVVCDTVAEFLKEKGIESELFRSEQTSIDLIRENSLFLFATSTWENGTLNPFYMKLYKEMNELDLTGKRAGFIGLGDIRYEPVLFCAGLDVLKKRFTEKGGEEIHVNLKLNGDPYEFLDTVVKIWVDNFIKVLNKENDSKK